jgi:hypothetical protein
MPQNDTPAAETPGGAPVPDETFLRRPENAVLLQAMLKQRQFSYQQLAIAAETTVNALRKRFAEQPEWRRLVSTVGCIPSRQPGPKQKLFRLRPAAAEAIRRLAAPAGKQERLLHYLPQLDNVTELLNNVDRCRERSPGLSFELCDRANCEFGSARDYLEEGAERGILTPSETIRQQVEGLKERLSRTMTQLHVASSDRLEGPEGIGTNERQAVEASCEEEGLSKYFYTMPDRSIRGYGGAMLAKTDRQRSNHRRLNTYFAERIGNSNDNNSFADACGHALYEVLRLSVYEPGWVTVAGRLIEGVRQITTLAGQHAILDAFDGAQGRAKLDPRLRTEIRRMTLHHRLEDAPPPQGARDLLACLDAG